MTDDSASLAAFLTAPVVPAVSFAFSSPGLGGGFSADFASLAGLSVIGYLCSLIAVGLLGLPTFFVLRKRGRVGFAASTVSGAVFGVIVAFVIVAPYTPTSDWLRDMGSWLQCLAVVGAATGFAFWTVRSLCLSVGSGTT
jgi:hypothetical protein